MKTILVTGGTGYIGSHTVVELLNQNNQVVVVDNLVNSSAVSLERIKKITGKTVVFYKEDVTDINAVAKIFANHKIDSVIHFAGLKAVGESVEKPLDYYQNNLLSTITLLKSMKKAGVKKIVFSSSATVYGADGPLDESMPCGVASSPYGNTKIMCEQIIKDECNADKGLKAILLRYFNPVGAHGSFLIGEDPQGIPNNLMPFITQVAVGKREKLNIFGNDYDTPDGTAERDYIHVVDLAIGHILAVKKLDSINGAEVYNLGAGKGISVQKIVDTFIKATGINIPYQYAPRRQGDLTQFYAVTKKAEKELDFKTTKTLHDMCLDHYNWQKLNPNGYN